MDLANIPLFQAIKQRMAWFKERQTLLAQNVANADTPGYVPQDLKPLDFRKLLGGQQRPLNMTITAPNQMSGTIPAHQYTPVSEPSPERTLSGNAVDLEGEMMKVYQTAADHQLVTNIYRQQLNMLKSVLGRGSS
ncbi:MAG TPA: flagellar basal body rod protein FlgB [Stellaceae bacterium]|nr:flagellar basal body rod protein FlgB [Stellaceae bacterium]